ncbi:MAG: discoidin domain-containing protein [Candidatus Pseudobacter hemicellulosilyticus]|uniref:Discoidin domain-containing protein n=1 Tax=Candidatus Pseudobacter hemicellulosilyticus TaxID=3121375 RepID=A0AAJ6BHL1_9BACT|nr:MAG: discoidin domain-containing protein [Pseudobacter sp.]
MQQLHRLLYILFIGLLTACQKDGARTFLPASSVSIQHIAQKDTLYQEMSIVKDSTIVLGLKAVLNGGPATEDHYVSFRIDTSRLVAFRSRYGSATVLPTTAYYFFQPLGRIPAGATESDSVQVNIFSQTSLSPETQYVLPVIIEQVDGRTEAVTPDEVLFIVIQTGASPTISKSGWKIVSASSYTTGGGEPENVLDNNDEATFWMSSFIQPMPQNLVIDFGKAIDFSGVSYVTPRSYATSGAYPTQVKIELSNDGSTWTDKGSFTGLSSTGAGTLDVGSSTARYMRFTAVKVFMTGFFTYVVIGGIGLEH